MNLVPLGLRAQLIELWTSEKETGMHTILPIWFTQASQSCKPTWELRMRDRSPSRITTAHTSLAYYSTSHFLPLFLLFVSPRLSLAPRLIGLNCRITLSRFSVNSIHFVSFLTKPKERDGARDKSLCLKFDTSIIESCEHATQSPSLGLILLASSLVKVSKRID